MDFGQPRHVNRTVSALNKLTTQPIRLARWARQEIAAERSASSLLAEPSYLLNPNFKGLNRLSSFFSTLMSICRHVQNKHAASAEKDRPKTSAYASRSTALALRIPQLIKWRTNQRPTKLQVCRNMGAFYSVSEARPL